MNIDRNSNNIESDKINQNQPQICIQQQVSIEQKLNSIWNEYKSEHNTIDAEGNLDDVVNAWISAHKDHGEIQSIVDKFNAFIKSGSLMRFFVADGKYNDKLYNKVDKNKDGNISWEEMKQYSERINSLKDVKKLANQLGIPLKLIPQEDNFENITLSDNDMFERVNMMSAQNTQKYDFERAKDDIGRTLDAMQHADSNGDNIVSYEEVNDVKDENERIILNRLYGIIDGSIDNEQGSYDNCYAITAQTALARKRPDSYAKVFIKYSKNNPDILKDCFIINSDNNKNFKEGDVIVKLALRIKSGVLTYVIPREDIIQKQREYAVQLNNNGNKENIGSMDPDAIALEETLKKIQNDNDLSKISPHITGMKGSLNFGNPAYVLKLLTGAPGIIIIINDDIKNKLVSDELARNSFFALFANNDHTFFLSFKENFKDIYFHHSYYVSDVIFDEATNLPKEFILTDSLDSNMTTKCSLEDFIEHAKALSISDI